MNVVLKALNNFGDPFIWRKFQKEFIKIFKQRQFMFLLIPRQFGKTEGCAHIVRDFVFRSKKHRNPNCLIVMQTYDNADKNYMSRLQPFFEDLPKSLVIVHATKSSDHAFIQIKRPWLGDVATIHFGTASTIKAVNSLRGRTIHLMILDEAAFYPDGAWLSVFQPMLDDTGGKCIITSTVNGPNFFMDLDMMAAENWKERKGNYGHYKLDVIQILKQEPELRDPDWLELKKAEYDQLGEPHRFAQEYMHDYYAGAKREMPLGEVISKMPDYGVINMPVHEPQYQTVYVQCDPGKAGNFATWAFIIDRVTYQPIIMHYSDEHDGIEAFLDYVADRFKHYRAIHVTFPHDIQNADLGRGKTFLHHAKKHLIRARYYGGKLRLYVSEKSSSVKQDWFYVAHQLPQFRFVATECRIGYEKLRRFRFTKDSKTGEVIWGTAVRNGCQHAADALRYTILVYETRVRGKELEGVDINNQKLYTETKPASDYKRMLATRRGYGKK